MAQSALNKLRFTIHHLNECPYGVSSPGALSSIGPVFKSEAKSVTLTEVLCVL
jgi:hypothetical protein